MNRSRASGPNLSIAPNTINFERLATEMVPIRPLTDVPKIFGNFFKKWGKVVFIGLIWTFIFNNEIVERVR